MKMFNVPGTSILAGPHPDGFFNELVELGVRKIIKLNKLPYSKPCPLPFVEIGIPDFGVPLDGQVDQFLHEINDGVYVHCTAGCGRTGTMLAIYLIAKGLSKSAEEAVATIRSVRPCALETSDQVQFIKDYYRSISYS